jgi:CRISPR-associated protein Cas2
MARPIRPPLLDPLAWRAMWVFALFDLPVETQAHRRAYARFRKDLIADGFLMMQYSVYFRHCANAESAVAHIRRMGARVPAEGEVRFMMVTDAQFARIQVFVGKKRKPPETPPAHLEFF